MRSLGDAARPLWRAPGALAVLLVPLLLIAGMAAALETLFTSGPGLWPWLGRLANRLFFVGLDVTFGSAMVVIGLQALEDEAGDWREAMTRAWRALPVTLPMSAGGVAVWFVADLFILRPISGQNTAAYLFYPLIQLAQLIVAILIATTWGQASFAALTGRPFAEAFGRGWAMARGARWKLGLLAFLLWLGEWFANDLANLLADLVVGGRSAAIVNGASQAAFILWAVVASLVFAAVGRRLAQVEDTRDPRALADTFS